MKGVASTSSASTQLSSKPILGRALESQKKQGLVSSKRRPLAKLDGDRVGIDAAARSKKTEPKSAMKSAREKTTIRQEGVSEESLESRLSWSAQLFRQIHLLAAPVQYSALLPVILNAESRLVMERLEKLVRYPNAGRMELRDGVDFHFDKASARDLLKILVDSLNLQYLRRGLEIMYGISLEVHSTFEEKEARLSIAKFIRQRVLFSTSLETEYQGRTQDQLYRDRLKRYGLYKLFFLLWICDQLKSLCLLPLAAPLFRTSSQHKSMDALLSAFSQRFLKGESRRIFVELAKIGYVLATHQKPIDELEDKFGDSIEWLDDGVQAGRWAMSQIHLYWSLLQHTESPEELAEAVRIKAREWRDLLDKFRFPASSALQKATNIKVLLDGLGYAAGGMRSIENRELAKRISNRDKLALSDFAWKLLADDCLSQLVRFQLPILQAETHRIVQGLNFLSPSASAFSMHGQSSDVAGSMLQWCQAICARSGFERPINSWAQLDDAVFCAIVHFYHRQLLPFESISLKRSASSLESEISGTMHATALRKVALHLGELPALMFHDDFKVRMSENARRCTLFILCHIMLRDCRAASAATAIQLCWRRYATRRVCAARRLAIMTLQRYWRGHLTRKAYRVELARQRQAIVTLQTAVRRHQARKAFLQLKSATVKLQALRRACLQRRWYLRLKQATIVLQSHVRANQARVRFLEQKTAAICIQAAFRGLRMRTLYQSQRLAAIRLQAWYRSRKARIHFNQIKNAAIVLQSRVRQVLCTRKYHRTRGILIMMQASVRMIQARRRFLTLQRSALRVQTAFRKYLARSTFLRQKQAAIQIQSSIRRHLQRAHFLKLRESAVRMQALFRMKRANGKYIQLKQAAVKLQSLFRGLKQRKQYLAQKRAAISLQSCIRRYLAQRTFQRLRSATILLQSLRRSAVERRKYLQQRKCAILIQKSIRRYQQRQVFLKIRQQHRAAIMIQSAYRGMKTRQFFLKHCATSIIHSAYRTFLIHRQQNK